MRWLVMLGDSVYGAYLDKEQALLDAVDAAREWVAVGSESPSLAQGSFERRSRVLGRTVKNRADLSGR